MLLFPPQSSSLGTLKGLNRPLIRMKGQAATGDARDAAIQGGGFHFLFYFYCGFPVLIHFIDVNQCVNAWPPMMTAAPTRNSSWGAGGCPGCVTRACGLRVWEEEATQGAKGRWWPLVRRVCRHLLPPPPKNQTACISLSAFPRALAHGNQRPGLRPR
jgi:hypothetical protein